MTDRNDAWKERWDARYGEPAYAYGEQPNAYLKERLDGLPPGKILFPAEGEGRNAVYAASLGWEVCAFDISVEGRKKALALAGRHGVHIDYRTDRIEDLPYQPASFDAVALIYAHFPPEIRRGIHEKINQWLRPGGTIIFEAFSTKNLEHRKKNPGIGGPSDVASLFALEDIRHDFPDYDIIELAEKEITLNEGLYHNGTGSVIRFTGEKKDRLSPKKTVV